MTAARDGRITGSPRGTLAPLTMRPKLSILSVVVVLLVPLQTGLAAQPAAEPGVLAIEGGRIITMAGEPIEGGAVLVSEGKIRAVGQTVEIPAGARRIDARGKTVIPGLVDAFSRLYVYPQELMEGTQIAPELRITDGVDPYDEDGAEVLQHGVTSVHAVPGSRSLLGGLSGVLKVAPEPGPLTVVSDGVAVRGQIGVPAGNSTSSLHKLATYASIREALLATRDYLWTWRKYERDLAQYEKRTEGNGKDGNGEGRKEQKPKGEKPDRPRKPSTDPGSEVLARVLREEVPLQIEAHRVADILNALRLKDEFDIELILLGCSEGHKIPGEIAKREVPVIVAPVSLSFVPPSRLKYGEHSRANAAVLADAGVEIALGVGGSKGLHSKFVRACAAVAAANGLGRDLALRAVTANAAEILGASDRIGTLAEGKDADIAIIGGEPLDIRSKVEMVIVDGAVAFERGVGD